MHNLYVYIDGYYLCICNIIYICMYVCLSRIVLSRTSYTRT